MPVTPDMAEDQFRLEPCGGDLVCRAWIPPVGVEGESLRPAVTFEIPFADRSLKSDLRRMKGQQGVGLTRIDNFEFGRGDDREIRAPPAEKVGVGEVVGRLVGPEVGRKDVGVLEKVGVGGDVDVPVGVSGLMEVRADAFLGKMSPCIETPVTHVTVGEIGNDFLEDFQGFRNRADAEEVIHSGEVLIAFRRLLSGIGVDQDRFGPGKGESVLDEVGVGIDEAEDLPGRLLEQGGDDPVLFVIVPDGDPLVPEAV